jgi:transcriptional regulator with XRE-family HTH domain
LNYCDFGEMLKKLRKSNGLTQKELGGHLGLSKAVVSKYENGMGYPAFDILIRIADYFGVTTDYLLGTEKGKTVDVSKLTESQIDVIHKLIAEFQKANTK